MEERRLAPPEVAAARACQVTTETIAKTLFHAQRGAMAKVAKTVALPLGPVPWQIAAARACQVTTETIAKTLFHAQRGATANLAKTAGLLLGRALW